MNAFELGWIVGFLEGEGSFACQKESKKKRGRTLCISANQVQKEPLERLVRYSGIGGVYGPYGPYDLSGKHSAQWKWRVHQVKLATELMQLLRPHMSPRRQVQIDEAMKRYAERPRRNASEITRKRNRTLSMIRRNDPRQLRIVP